MDNNKYFKYLKYKNKYLSLKDKYLKLKNNLVGGANCPQEGFYQHITECFNDSFLMIVLYSDGFSERIQTIFDNIPNDIFLSDCVKYAYKNSNELFMPLQIQSDADKALFYEHGPEYIKNIFDRYHNEKKPFINDDISLTSIVKGLRPVYDSAKVVDEVELPDKHKLYRLDSVNQSLTCAYTSNELTNINIMEDLKQSYSHNIHNATSLHELNNISLINYYLTNFLPEGLHLPDKRKQFLSNINFHFIDIFLIKQLNHSTNIIMTISNIYRNLEELYNLIEKSDNLLGINISISDIKAEYLLGDDNLPSGHYVCFLKCNGQEKFYDNNRVSDILPDDIDFDIYEPESDIDRLKKFPKLYMKKEGPLMINFKWREYLLITIKKCQAKLIQLMQFIQMSIYRDNDVIINNILQIFESMSDLFKPGSNKIGREYLETQLIINISLYFVNELDEHHIREQFISANIANILKYYTMYENDRIFDLISESITDDMYLDIFFKVAGIRNLKLISRLLEEDKFPPDVKMECIDLIIGDIFNQPYDKSNEDVIKTVLSYSKLSADFKKYIIDKGTDMDQDDYVKYIKRI